MTVIINSAAYHLRPLGLCACGCGSITPLAKKTSSAKG